MLLHWSELIVDINGILDTTVSQTSLFPVRNIHVGSLRGLFTLLSLMLRTCNGIVSGIKDNFLVFIHLYVASTVKTMLVLVLRRSTGASSSVRYATTFRL